MKHNPTIKDRTIYQALGHAEQNRFELPLVAQVWPSDWDLCVLADEIYRLRTTIRTLEDKLVRLTTKKKEIQ